MRASWWSLRDRLAVVVGLLLPCAMAAGLAPIRHSIPNTDAALVLVAAVVLVAANGHRVAGGLAALSAAAWFDFFLTTPYEHFSIAHRRDLETTLLLIGVGVAVTELAVRGRRQRLLAQTDALYLDALATTVDALSGGRSPGVEKDLADVLTDLLGLRACRFEVGRIGGMPRLDADGQIRDADRAWDLDQFGMPDRDIELLVTSNGVGRGRFVLTPTPGVVPPLEARRVSYVLAKLIASALGSSVAVAEAS